MMTDISKPDTTQEEFEYLSGLLDERSIRLWCALKALVYNQLYGRGGITVVHEVTGAKQSRIYAGMV